jgi:nitrite reductase/ring-hydroxylating ferredoxin subunit
MRMTRDSYAREVWKAVEALHSGQDQIPCPHENCEELLNISATSIRAGTAIVCPEHGVIYRDWSS